MARKHCTPHARSAGGYRRRLLRRGLSRAPEMAPGRGSSTAHVIGWLRAKARDAGQAVSDGLADEHVAEAMVAAHLARW